MYLKKTFYLFFLLIFAWLTIPHLYAQKEVIPVNLNKPHNFFIENKGQWDRQVKFLARLGGLNAWVTDSGIVFDFYKIERNETQPKDSFLADFHHNPLDTNISIKGHVIKMTFPGNTKTGSVRTYEGKNPQETYYNYFIGNDSTKWASYVKLFEEVYIQNVADGIDMRLYFDDNKLRYDYVINPGADLGNLKFDILGSDSISVSPDGKLVLKTSLGVVLNDGIKAFQMTGNKEEAVACKFFKIDDQTVGFNIAGFDKTKKLIIDPYVYATYLGDYIYSEAHGITVDNIGCTYVTGQTQDPGFPVKSGAYMNTFHSYSGPMAFITKFNRDLSGIFYSTFLGGSLNTHGYDIVLDNYRNVIIAGTTECSNFPVTSGVFQLTYHGASDYFITKLNSNCSALLFSTYLGGTKSEHNFTRLFIDNTQNIWITGNTKSSDFPTSSGAFQTTLGGGYPEDAFISELNSTGTGLLYSTFLGGNGFDWSGSITIDKNNNIYVAGTTSSSNFFTTTGCYQSTLLSNYTGFITKFDSAKRLIYSTYFGSTDSNTSIADIKVDQFGYVYLTGGTMGSNFPTTINAFQKNLNGGQNAFITKFDPASSALIYSTFLGGSGIDQGVSLSIDTFGNVFITGRACSSDFPVTLNAFQKCLKGINSTFMTILKNDFSALIYSTYWGGNNGGVTPRDNYLDNNYSIYYSGETTSTDFPVSPNAFQKTNNGSSAFVVKMNAVANIIHTRNVTGSPFCPGDTIHVTFTTFLPLWTGNVFFAQLSDTTGDFFYPVNIGSLSDTSPGTIIARIPTSAIYGRKYRIRVISTAPFMCSQTASNYFTINPSPAVVFNKNNLTQCAESPSYSFLNSSKISSGKITGFTWDFGDSTSGFSVKDTSHTYKNFSKYKVSLIAISDSGCADTAINYVTIAHKPKASFVMDDSVQCFKKNRFQFTDSSVSYYNSLQYNWDFGDGDTSSLNNPVHYYDSFNNNYFPKLIITDSLGCKDTSTGHIYILPSPSAGFKASDTVECFNNNSFWLNDTSTISSGNISAKNWNLGDGNMDTSINIIHHYLTIDTFKVSLIITSDKGCSDTAFRNIYTLTSPSADFLVNDTSQCFQGNLFAFNPVYTASCDKFRWFFGDGKSDTNKSAFHNYASTGSYNLKLVTVNNLGCIDSAIKRMVVNPEPKADFKINNNMQCLNGNSFSFNNLSHLNSPNGSWQWDFGDGNYDTGKSVVHGWLTADTFSVKLIATNQFDCKDSIEKTVFVLPSPDAGFIVNDSAQCLKANQFIFAGIKNQANCNINWSFGDGTPHEFTDSVIHSYSSSGSFNVNLVLKNLNQCKDSSQKTVMVYPAPDATFTVNNSSQCLKGNLFVFTSKNQSVTSNFNWNFGDINTSTATNPTHTYINTGNYQVILVVTTKDNCQDTTSQAIRVKLNPVTPVASGNSHACEGKTLGFMAASNPNSSYHWWADNGFTSDLQNFIITNVKLSDSGIYYVKAILDGCESDTTVIKVIIYPTPVLNLGLDKTICEGDLIELDPGFFSTYLWQDSSRNRIFHVVEPGIYRVEVSNLFGCINSDEIVITEKCPSGIFIPAAFSPNGDGINDDFVIVTNELKHFEIRIYDRWGECVFHSTDPAFSWDGTYKGITCPVGVYTYLVSATGQDAVIRDYRGMVTLVR